MSRRNTKINTLILVVVIGGVALVIGTFAVTAVSGAPTAQDKHIDSHLAAGTDTQTAMTEKTQEFPETPAEFLSTFRGLEGVTAYESHSEFEVIRSQAVQDVQVGEFTDTKRQRLQLVLEVLWTFDEAFQAQENESYSMALDIANETRGIIQQLRETTRGEEYALLANIALDRFNEQTAQRLLTQAEEIENTPTRIEVLSRAAKAYNQAGATDRFAQVALRADKTQQRFQTDFETLNGTRETTTGFLNNCGNCDSVETLVTSDILAVFNLYSESLTAVSASDEGLDLAAQHGLSEIGSALGTKHSTATEYRETLAIASASLIVGYSLIVGFVAALISWRLMLWKRDFTDAQRGDVILMGEMLNA